MGKRYSLPGAVIPGTAIRVITGKVARIKPGQIKRLLWDWDGNFSLVRAGWQKIMAPVMVESIIGNSQLDNSVVQAVCQRVDQVILETTGIRTIKQMEILVELVREHGFVSDDKMLDAWGYKRLYLDRLMVPVNERIARLESGQISRKQLAVRGALDALAAMASRGVQMQVFSGTDRPDVVREVGIVTGNAGYFCEIHGAAVALKSGEPEVDKVDVLRSVLEKGDLSPDQISGGGDGKVEVSVLHEAGCLAIGIASDEETGCGWNLAKAESLTNAGADILMPDWRWYGQLIALLGLK